MSRRAIQIATISTIPSRCWLEYLTRSKLRSKTSLYIIFPQIFCKPISLVHLSSSLSKVQFKMEQNVSREEKPNVDRFFFTSGSFQRRYLTFFPLNVMFFLILIFLSSFSHYLMLSPFCLFSTIDHVIYISLTLFRSGCKSSITLKLTPPLWVLYVCVSEWDSVCVCV